MVFVVPVREVWASHEKTAPCTAFPGRRRAANRDANAEAFTCIFGSCLSRWLFSLVLVFLLSHTKVGVVPTYPCWQRKTSRDPRNTVCRFDANAGVSLITEALA
mmetsp:Transcript_17151/g.39871  ORF Transcript_17151/g.39871 Transcript_17151/m.39871 type:complete len:104 (-) Transcript_17151:215-526(-)